MSVVLATICTDGLAIAADREISGSGFKYYEPKIEKVRLSDTYLVLGYAGLPDRMRAISEELRKRLEPDHLHDEIEHHLQQTLEKVIPRNEKYPAPDAIWF
jgi:20S proteasome alpha/beta subunit